jgi:hypothetical protein
MTQICLYCNGLYIEKRQRCSPKFSGIELNSRPGSSVVENRLICMYVHVSTFIIIYYGLRNNNRKLRKETLMHWDYVII